jgi:hypothetical protein
MRGDVSQVRPDLGNPLAVNAEQAGRTAEYLFFLFLHGPLGVGEDFVGY